MPSTDEQKEYVQALAYQAEAVRNEIDDSFVKLNNLNDKLSQAKQILWDLQDVEARKKKYEATNIQMNQQ